jgi:hypothetical protein
MSSSRMINEALSFFPINAPTGALNLRLNASLPSGVVSFVIGMVMVFEGSPAAKKSVPEVAV